VPRKSQNSAFHLTPLTEIDDPDRFGPSLVQLAKLALDGVPVLSTAAWATAAFRQLDKRQRSDHSLGALVRQAHKRGHRSRCRAAQRFVHESELEPSLTESAFAFTRTLAVPADANLWIWTSFVADADLAPETRFGLATPLTPEALAQNLCRAFESAYHPDLVRSAALAGIKGYSLAVALSVLPPNAALGELWLAGSAEESNAEHERAPHRPALAMHGRLHDRAPDGPHCLDFSFDGELHFEANAPLPEVKPPLTALSRLRATLLPGTSLDFSLSDQLAVAALSSGSVLPAERSRWVSVQDDQRGLPSEVTLSLLEQIVEDVVRPLFEQADCSLHRRDKLIEPAHGELCLDAPALTQALGKEFASESRWLSELLRQPQPDRPARPVEARFVLPRLFATLTVTETKLRTSLREFEADAHQHRLWLQELDLSILPNDALRNTLREAVGFVKRTVDLYLQAKFGMVRALTAVTSLAALSDDRRPIQRVFTALRGLGEVASAQPCLEAIELSRAIALDTETARALSSGVTALADLPQGIATAEIVRFLARHGDQPTHSWDLGSPRWQERPEALLRVLAVTTGRWSGSGRVSTRPVEPTAAQMVERIASAAGWLEKRAIAALLARAAGFIRVHEQLRVWLGRCTGLLRSVLLDADRRLQRRDPSLPAGVVWLSGLDDIAWALAGDPGRLNVSVGQNPRSAALTGVRGARPAGRRVPGPRSAPTRLQGNFTGTGSFTGTVLRLDSLAGSRRGITKDHVLVCTSLDSLTCLAAVHAGALLADGGGPLSLAAVTARELGVPTVLGLGPELTLLDNGDRVFVDGDRGIVERHA
jgi:phosphohistidine swiveling domain-containing protein